SSVTGEVSENLKVQLNVDAILEDKNAPSYDVNQVVHYTWMNIPTFPVYANNTSPYLQDFGYPFHPIAVTTADISGYRKTKTKTFQGNLTLDYKIRPIEGLSAKLMYGFYSTDVFEKVWQKKYSVFTYDQLADAYL